MDEKLQRFLSDPIKKIAAKELAKSAFEKKPQDTSFEVILDIDPRELLSKEDLLRDPSAREFLKKNTPRLVAKYFQSMDETARVFEQNELFFANPIKAIEAMHKAVIQTWKNEYDRYKRRS